MSFHDSRSTEVLDEVHILMPYQDPWLSEWEVAVGFQDPSHSLTDQTPLRTPEKIRSPEICAHAQTI